MSDCFVKSRYNGTRLTPKILIKWTAGTGRQHVRYFALRYCTASILKYLLFLPVVFSVDVVVFVFVFVDCVDVVLAVNVVATFDTNEY